MRNAPVELNLNMMVLDAEFPNAATAPRVATEIIGWELPGVAYVATCSDIHRGESAMQVWLSHAVGKPAIIARIDQLVGTHCGAVKPLDADLVA